MAGARAFLEGWKRLLEELGPGELVITTLPSDEWGRLKGTIRIGCLQVQRTRQQQNDQDDEQQAPQTDAGSAVTAVGRVPAHSEAAAQEQDRQDDEDDEQHSRTRTHLSCQQAGQVRRGRRCRGVGIG